MNDKYREIVDFMSGNVPYKRIDLTENLDSTLSQVGYDSLGFIEMIVLAEERFEIQISQSDFPEGEKVGDYVQMIYDKTEQKDGRS
jgi:acyl carrier protein